MFFIAVLCLSSTLFGSEQAKKINAYKEYLATQKECTILLNPPIKVDDNQRWFTILDISMCNPIGFCNPFNPPKRQLQDHLTRHYRLGSNKMSEYPEKHSLQAAVLQRYGIQMDEPETTTCCGKTMDYQNCHDRLGCVCWNVVLWSVVCVPVDPGCAAVTCATASCVLCAQRASQLNDIKIKQKK